MENLKQRVAKGAVWVTVEKFSTQIAAFVVSMILARLLTPHDYGCVAMLSIFMAVANSVINCGFGNALVQQKKVGELEFNSVFYLSLGVSIIMYGLLFVLAPLIAEFYKMPILIDVTRVMALNLILGALNSIQGAELTREMLFRKRFRISVITCLVSSVGGITLAYFKFGVWALVWSALLANVSSVIAYWMIIAWRPKLMFSLASVRGLFSYGWKLSLSWMIHTIYTNLYGFFVGRYYTASDLAFVNRGRNMPELLMNTIDGTIVGVSFPALARLQDDHEAFKRAMRKMIQCSTFLVFPLLTGLALCAEPVVLLFFGEQWRSAVPYMRWFCLSVALNPFCSINVNAISALGRSDVFLILEIIKKGTGLLVMLLTIKHGVLAFVFWMAVIMSPFSALVNMIPNIKLLNYTPINQLRDVLPSTLFSAGMACAVFICELSLQPVLTLIPLKPVAYFVELLVDMLVGSSAYFSLAFLTKDQTFCEYFKAIRPLVRRHVPSLVRWSENYLGIDQ